MYKKICIVLASLVLLPACYRVPKYRSQTLQFVDDKSGYHESRNGLIVRAKRLTNYDKKELFGQYSKKLSCYPRGPIEVIYLSLHNLSPIVYVLPSTGIDLEMVPHADIARLMKTSTGGRILGFMGSWFGIMAGYIGMGTGLCMLLNNDAPKGSGLIPLVGGVSATIAGAVYADRYASSIGQSLQMNERITTDLEDKAMPEGALIQPGDKYEGLIFVHSADYTPQFSVTVREKDNRHNRIIFDVDVHASFKNVDQESLQA